MAKNNNAPNRIGFKALILFCRAVIKINKISKSITRVKLWLHSAVPSVLMMELPKTKAAVVSKLSE